GLETVAVETLLKDCVIAVDDGGRIFVERNELVEERRADAVGVRCQCFHATDDAWRDCNRFREVITAQKEHVPVFRKLRQVLGEQVVEGGVEDHVIFKDEDVFAVIQPRLLYGCEMTHRTSEVLRAKMAEMSGNNGCPSIDGGDAFD